MIYLLLRADDNDVELKIRAFSTAAARDKAFAEPKYKNWECADVEVDGATFDRDA